MTEKTTKKINIDQNARYRVSIFRSNKAIYAQIIDDKAGTTIASASSLKLLEKKTACEKALMTGEALAKIAEEMKIKKVSYNRGNYRYHGQVKTLADGMRKGGLSF